MSSRLVSLIGASVWCQIFSLASHLLILLQSSCSKLCNLRHWHTAFFGKIRSWKKCVKLEKTVLWLDILSFNYSVPSSSFCLLVGLLLSNVWWELGKGIFTGHINISFRISNFERLLLKKMWPCNIRNMCKKCHISLRMLHYYVKLLFSKIADSTVSYFF